MSGSGSCLFAILRDMRAADQLAAETQTEFGTSFRTIACRTL
jgi:4-diphosphocytidyl-2C-methyl-D-erythritol kinase